MQKDSRPQPDSDSFRSGSGSHENDQGTKVIDQHGAYDSPCGATLFLGACEPAGNAQCEQRHTGHAADGQAGAGYFGTQQYLHDERRHKDQR